MGDVVADADGDQLHRGVILDLVDRVLQMLFEVVRRIHEQRRVIDGQTVGNDHQQLALLGASHDAIVRPDERLAVDILLQQVLSHHQAKIALRPAPGVIGALVDDVAKVVQAPGL